MTVPPTKVLKAPIQGSQKHVSRALSRHGESCGAVGHVFCRKAGATGRYCAREANIEASRRERESCQEVAEETFIPLPAFASTAPPVCGGGRTQGLEEERAHVQITFSDHQVAFNLWGPPPKNTHPTLLPQGTSVETSLSAPRLGADMRCNLGKPDPLETPYSNYIYGAAVVFYHQFNV